jgi:hypothetical protein
MKKLREEKGYEEQDTWLISFFSWNGYAFGVSSSGD